MKTTFNTIIYLYGTEQIMKHNSVMDYEHKMTKRMIIDTQDYGTFQVLRDYGLNNRLSHTPSFYYLTKLPRKTVLMLYFDYHILKDDVCIKHKINPAFCYVYALKVNNNSLSNGPRR